jgi:CBS domain-containing protein
MRELGTGGFAVVDNRGLLGVITERDLVKRMYDRKGLSFFSELFLKNRSLLQV